MALTFCAADPVEPSKRHGHYYTDFYVHGKRIHKKIHARRKDIADSMPQTCVTGCIRASGNLAVVALEQATKRFAALDWPILRRWGVRLDRPTIVQSRVFVSCYIARRTVRPHA